MQFPELWYRSVPCCVSGSDDAKQPCSIGACDRTVMAKIASKNSNLIADAEVVRDVDGIVAGFRASPMQGVRFAY